MTHLDDLAALRDAARLARRAIAETGANARRSGALADDDDDTRDTLDAALDVLGDLADILDDGIAARRLARARHPAGRRRLLVLDGGAP